jgi:2-oxo-4-hydroxy-4-carboxy-5-ureidoimidazoline decarboxylase
MPAESPEGLTRLNDLARPQAEAALLEVCAAPAWAAALAAARPFAGPGALYAASDAATAALDGPGLDAALAGHAQIGRPAPGDPGSAREQRGMAGADPALAERMRQLNSAYLDRFGHVFLVCASGLTARQLHDAAAARLARTPEEERAAARTELGRINRLRLARLAGDPQPERPATVSTHVLDTSAGRPAAGIAVRLEVRAGGNPPLAHAEAVTDADGRCTGLPPLPPGTGSATLTFATGPHLAAVHGKEAFFPEAAVTFATAPGEHYHVPLLLNPYGYSVYRGS